MIEHLPLFFIMVFLGVAVNLISIRKLTLRRVIKEILASILIAVVVGSGLEHYTDWSVTLISGVSSLAGYFSSKILDLIKEEVLVSTAKAFSNKIKSVLKTKEDSTDENTEEDEFYQ